jgi:hypothetical protein
VEKNHSEGGPHIRPEMTALEVLRSYRQTKEVFKKYDEKTGRCICCDALFESLRTIADRYGLDLEELLRDLEAVAK